MSFLVGILIILAEGGLCFFSGDIPKLMGLMLPGVFFITLFGLTSGLLQAEKSFFIPSVAPIGFNLIWILGMMGFRHAPIEKAVIGLSIILSLAFMAQWIFTIPKMWKFLRKHLSIREMFSGKIFSRELKTLVGPLLFGVIGVTAMQINSAIDGVFARWADLEGPAYLWYAIRLQQLPLALFGIAISSALLPSLSRKIERGDEEGFVSLIQFAYKRTFTLIFPCVIGIFVLGAASMNLLFGRGDFSELATAMSTSCLWCYGIGLLPAALVLILAPAFYAKKDYKTPMIGALGASLLNIALNGLLVFVFRLGAVSIALATSITAILNAIYLGYKLNLPMRSLASKAKTAACALVSGGIVILFGRLIGDATTLIWIGEISFEREFSMQVIQLFSQTILYFAGFFALGKLFHVEDIDALKKELLIPFVKN